MQNDCPSSSTDRAEIALATTCLQDECLPFLDVSTINSHWRRACNEFPAPWNETVVVGTRLIRHKPGKRLLVEYALASTDGSGKLQVIGKAKIAKRINQDLLKLHAELQTLRLVGVHVPRVIGQAPSMNLWFQEKIFGRHVLNDADPTNHQLVGEGLAELHRSRVTIPRSHTVEDELRILRLQYEQWLMPLTDLRAPSLDLLALAEKSASHLLPVGNVPIHRDFYFDQVLITKDGVAILDFDLASIGPAELDVGNYLAHLHEYHLRVGSECVGNEAAQAFMAGYLSVRPELCLQNIKVWHDLSLARLVAISQRIPSRAATTQRLLNLCQDRFDSSPLIAQSKHALLANFEQ